MKEAKRCRERPAARIASRSYGSAEEKLAETAEASPATSWSPPAAGLPLCCGETRWSDTEADGGALSLASDGGGVAGTGSRRRRRVGDRGPTARCGRRLRRDAEAAGNPPAVWIAGGEDCRGLQ